MLGFFAFGFAGFGLPPAGNAVTLSSLSKSRAGVADAGLFTINAVFLDAQQVRTRWSTTPLITLSQTVQAATSSISAAVALQVAMRQLTRTMTAAMRSFTSATVPLRARATAASYASTAVTFLAMPFAQLQISSMALQGANFVIGASAAVTEAVNARSAAVLALAAQSRVTATAYLAAANRLAVAAASRIKSSAQAQALAALFAPLALQTSARAAVAQRAVLIIAARCRAEALTRLGFAGTLAAPLAARLKASTRVIARAVLGIPLASRNKFGGRMLDDAALIVAAYMRSPTSLKAAYAAKLALAAASRTIATLMARGNSDSAIRLSPTRLTAAAHARLGQLATINIRLFSRATAVIRSSVAPFFHDQKYLAVAPRRHWVVAPKAFEMARTLDLSPAIDAVVEIAAITFDFGYILQPGDTLVSVSQIKCAVETGNDPSPSSRIQGFSMIGTSPETGAPQAAVQQLFGNMVADCDYILQCVALTASGQTLSVWSRLSCEAVG